VRRLLASQQAIREKLPTGRKPDRGHRRVAQSFASAQATEPAPRPPPASVSVRAMLTGKIAVDQSANRKRRQVERLTSDPGWCTTRRSPERTVLVFPCPDHAVRVGDSDAPAFSAG